MCAARIGYVGGSHLCIKAVGTTIITPTIGAIPHFLLWVVYMQRFCEMKMGWIMRKSRYNGPAHKKGRTAKVKCHAALKASLCPMGLWVSHRVYC